MPDDLEFPIDLFEFLIWAGSVGRYTSRSESRKTGKPATADLALEKMRAATTSAREDPRIGAYGIALAYWAYRWAYQLERQKDLQRKIARAGEVKQSQVGHAASITEEYRKRHDPAPPDKGARLLMGNADVFASRETDFDLDASRESFEQALRTLIAPDLLAPNGYRMGTKWFEPAHLLSVGVLEVQQLPELAQSYGEQACNALLRELFERLAEATSSLGIVELTREFEFLRPPQDSIYTESQPEPARIQAAARLDQSTIAVATDIVLRRDLKRVLEHVIDKMTSQPIPIGEDKTSITLHGGVTDFFDYPVHLPKANYRKPTIAPFLSNALAALRQAKASGDNQVAIYEPDIAQQLGKHRRTPE